jgi:hypothetical protein
MVLFHAEFERAAAASQAARNRCETSFYRDDPPIDASITPGRSPSTSAARQRSSHSAQAPTDMRDQALRGRAPRLDYLTIVTVAFVGLDSV